MYMLVYASMQIHNPQRRRRRRFQSACRSLWPDIVLLDAQAGSNTRLDGCSYTTGGYNPLANRWEIIIMTLGNPTTSTNEGLLAGHFPNETLWRTGSIPIQKMDRWTSQQIRFWSLDVNSQDRGPRTNTEGPLLHLASSQYQLAQSRGRILSRH